MSNYFYKKYVDFLTEHKLFDYKVANYLWINSAKIDFETANNNVLIGCSTVIDINNKLLSITPCFSYLNNDCMVAMNIYTYVNSLFLLPQVGRKYNEDIYGKTLALFYQKLYILENKNYELVELEKLIDSYLLKDGSLTNKLLLNNVDKMIENYNFSKINVDKNSRKIKRLARDSIYHNKL